jgi:hypothetical protein
VLDALNKSAEVPSMLKAYMQNKAITAKLRVRTLRCIFSFCAIELSGYVPCAGTHVKRK